MKPVPVYFSLGTNQGDRQARIEEALRRLDAAIGRPYEALSSIIETPSWGFVGPDFLNCPARLAKAFADSAEVGNEIFDFASHEQYSFPYYHNYIPDHLERIAKAAELMVENGCKPVFFAQGYMGNDAWDD